MDVKFPQGFYFGSATSAPQSEGAHGIDRKAPDIWDLWFEEEHHDENRIFADDAAGEVGEAFILHDRLLPH